MTSQIPARTGLDNKFQLYIKKHYIFKNIFCALDAILSEGTRHTDQINSVFKSLWRPVKLMKSRTYFVVCVKAKLRALGVISALFYKD